MQTDLERWTSASYKYLPYAPFRAYIPFYDPVLFGRIVGRRFENTNKLCDQISKDVHINNLTGYSNVLVLSADTKDNLDKIVSIINSVIDSSSSIEYSNEESIIKFSEWTPPTNKLPSPLSSESKTRHILIDNSNIFFSARQSSSKPSWHNDCTMRISSKNLSELLEINNSQKIGSRFVAGSEIKKGTSIWSSYERIGYTCMYLPQDQNKREKGVDSALHSVGLQIASEAQYLEPGSNTLVIATGDGNNNDSLTSFPKTVFAAAQAGMRVEIWSWSYTRSKNYQRIVDHFTDGRVTLHDLDPHFNNIVYYVRERESPDRVPRERERERSRSRAPRERERSRSRDRAYVRERERDRSRSRNRAPRERDRSRSRDRAYVRERKRDRDYERDRENDKYIRELVNSYFKYSK